MNKFPLCHLPLVVLGIVLRQMDLFALVGLSLQSKYFRRILMMFKLPMTMITYTANDQPRFSITREKEFLNICFGGSRGDFPWSINNGQVAGKMKRTGFVSNFFIDVPVGDSYTAAEMEKLMIAGEFIISCFKSKDVRVNSWLYFSFDLNEWFMWRLFNKFSCVYIEQFAELTPARITYLLETVEIKSLSLEINVLSEEEFIYERELPEPAKFDSFSIKTTDWININTILNDVNPFQAELNVKFGNELEKENSILNQWIRGFGQLQQLVLHHSHCPKYENPFLEVFKGIVTVNTDFTLEQLSSRYKFEESPDDLNNNPNVKDITRDIDSRKATVIVSHSMTTLLVWTDEELRMINR